MIQYLFFKAGRIRKYLTITKQTIHLCGMFVGFCSVKTCFLFDIMLPLTNSLSEFLQ